MNYYKVLLAEEAQRDIHLAKEWQAKTDPFLGEQLMGELNRIFHHLEKHAEEYPRTSFGKFRKLAMPQFPFTLVYKMLDEQVIILALAHQQYALERFINP